MSSFSGFHDPLAHGGQGSGAYLDARTNILSKIADRVADPPDSGLSAQLDRFWDSWAEAADDPSALAARRAVLERANAVTRTLHAITAALVHLAEYAQDQLDRSIIRVTATSQSSSRLSSTIDDVRALRPTDGTAWAQSEAVVITIPGYRAWLDRIARTLAGDVNELHNAGYDLGGTPGGPFFSGVTASTISVVPSRPGGLVASATVYPDATIARQLAELGRAADNAGSAYRALVASVEADRQSVLAQAARRRAAANTPREAVDPATQRDAAVNRLLAYRRGYQGGCQALDSVEAAIQNLGGTAYGHGPDSPGPDSLDVMVEMSALEQTYAVAEHAIAGVRQTSVHDFVR